MGWSWLVGHRLFVPTLILFQSGLLMIKYVCINSNFTVFTILYLHKHNSYATENLHATYLKVKLSLYLTKHHAMKTCWESGGIAACILDLGTKLYAPAALPLRKEPLVSIG
jgi:hypothetical protein